MYPTSISPRFLRAAFVNGLLFLCVMAHAADALAQTSGPDATPTPKTAAVTSTSSAPLISLSSLPTLTEVSSQNSAIIPEVQDVPLHRSFVELAKKGGIDVLFVGDSITDWWRSTGKDVWVKYYGSMKAANFGIAGNTTQDVLWRLQNGEGEGFQPKVVVLMIGTNNFGRNTDAQVAEGVAAVVHELRTRFASAKILLLGIFPRGPKENPVRDRVRNTNLLIAKLDDGKNVFYLDIGAKFLEPDGTLTAEIMPDGLHPSAKGYEIWGAAMQEPLAKLLK